MTLSLEVSYYCAQNRAFYECLPYSQPLCAVCTLHSRLVLCASQYPYAIFLRVSSKFSNVLYDISSTVRPTDLNYWIKHPFEFSDPILKPEYL